MLPDYDYSKRLLQMEARLKTKVTKATNVASGTGAGTTKHIELLRTTKELQRLYFGAMKFYRMAMAEEEKGMRNQTTSHRELDLLLEMTRRRKADFEKRELAVKAHLEKWKWTNKGAKNVNE